MEVKLHQAYRIDSACHLKIIVQELRIFKARIFSGIHIETHLLQHISLRILNSGTHARKNLILTMNGTCPIQCSLNNCRNLVHKLNN